MTLIFPDFERAYQQLRFKMVHQAVKVHTETWQRIDISQKPDAVTYELMDVHFRVPLGDQPLEHWRYTIKPNLPWADDHFERERVSGHPINPGETWKTWPWSLSADKHRTMGEQFSHSYAERYWPKMANFTEGGILPDAFSVNRRQGIRYLYGDLNDVIYLLAREPHTRQAVLPVWFPEDTGVTHGERVPCSLTYQFLMRGGHLHVIYTIRSCDFYRHFRDDIYLTVRLLLWILEKLRNLESPMDWEKVQPGLFTMQIGSLHAFVNDIRILKDQIEGK